MNTVLGTKSEMTTRYDSAGKRLTVTIVNVEPNTVVEKKSVEKAGYDAVVLGIGSKKRGTKALMKKLSGAGKVPKHIKETRGADPVEVGAQVKVSDVLAVGDVVAVTGVTKGKGFTGVVKRYNFRGGPKTHGQSDRHRARGSLGSGTTPGRVFPGLRMAGRHGGSTSTVRNLIVVHINEANGQVLLSGPVPGHRNGLVIITKIGEKKNFGGIELMEADKQEEVSVKGEEEVVVEEQVVEAVEPVVSAEEAPTENTASEEVADVKEGDTR